MDSSDFFVLLLAQLVSALSGEERKRGGGQGLVVLLGNGWRSVQEKQMDENSRERGEELWPLPPPHYPLVSCTGCSPVSSITGLSLAPSSESQRDRGEKRSGVVTLSNGHADRRAKIKKKMGLAVLFQFRLSMLCNNQC